ncbi:MAG TPA: isoprenylcysteine carboxylmethyltransferase family protein [bacterium]|nr:isoprenylcysteine carboxylmethyltransferase family protein [bacterium]
MDFGLPPSKNSCQFWTIWIFSIISYLGIILLSILDWNSFVLSHWSRYPIGFIFLTMGFIIAILGVKALSVHSSLGLKGTLIIQGIYKYTRNPQYLGDILLFIGIIIISNSLLTFINGFLGILWNILTPFTEEPWLKKQFKEDYVEYCKKVRRLI